MHSTFEYLLRSEAQIAEKTGDHHDRCDARPAAQAFFINRNEGLVSVPRRPDFSRVRLVL